MRGQLKHECSKCGAPRDWSLPLALCREHYNEMMREYQRKARRAKGAVEQSSAPPYQIILLRRAYRRLGLKPGHVWEKVR